MYRSVLALLFASVLLLSSCAVGQQTVPKEKSGQETNMDGAAFDRSDEEITYMDTTDNVIDPTVQNRQGNDRGSQYQTGVYFTNESARETVKRIAEIERGRSEKFFYPAEEYHQNYLEKNPNGYCHIPRLHRRVLGQV